MTFDYSRVYKDLPGTYIELGSRVYNYLSNLKYKSLFTADLKYIYLTILLYPYNRYYFIFTILGIG